MVGGRKMKTEVMRGGGKGKHGEEGRGRYK